MNMDTLVILVLMIFDMFPGGWEISQWSNNVPAQKFWEKIVVEYTNGKYDTFTVIEKDVIGVTFDNSLG